MTKRTQQDKLIVLAFQAGFKYHQSLMNVPVAMPSDNDIIEGVLDGTEDTED